MRTKNRDNKHVFWRITAASLLVVAYLGINTPRSGALGSDCLSPRTTSPVYTGNRSSGVTTSDKSSWRMGVLAITPQPASDIIVGYKSPDESTWHDSKPVASRPATRTLLRIGPGDIQFSALYHAPGGSPACNTAPPARFSPAPQPLNSIDQNTTQPDWP